MTNPVEQTSDTNFVSPVMRLIRVVTAIGNKRSFFCLALIVLGSLTEGIGVALFIPMMQLVGVQLESNGFHPGVVAELTSFGARLGVNKHAAFAVILMCVCALITLRTALNRLQHVQFGETVQIIANHIMVNLYDALVHAKWNAITRYKSGALIQLLTGDYERLKIAIYDLFTFISGVVAILIYLAWAFIISPQLTCMFMASGAVLAFALRKRTGNVHNAASNAGIQLTVLSNDALEHLQNLKAVKTYDAQAQDLALYSVTLNKIAALYSSMLRSEAAARFWFEGGTLAALAVILYCVSTLSLVAASSILIVIGLFSRIMPKLSTAYMDGQSVIANATALSRIDEVIERLEGEAESLITQRQHISFVEEIRLLDVSFYFGKEKVLDSISMSIHAGQMTALVGPSGAGKSTIADIIMGLYVPDFGQVTVDGMPLTSKRLSSWRTQIGYVSQDTVLFHDTVRANLLWANPMSSEKTMLEALEVSAAEFVLEHRDGLDMIVGDRGLLLSNGERQRIALARAIIRNPALLILDEATNHLDVENERRVLQSILRVRGQMAILTVAHRYSAIRNADKVYLIDCGKIMESGSYIDLEEDVGGRFRRFFDGQAI